MDGEYLGYREAALSDEELSAFYEGGVDLTANPWGLLTNEYLVLRSGGGDPAALLKWNGERLVKIQHHVVSSRFYGKVRARNLQQQLALDMLYDQNVTIKVLGGPFGTGKDFLMISAAIELLEKGRFDRIIWVRNNVEVKDSRPIGHLPGAPLDKLLPFAMPLADHLGGTDSLELLVSQGRAEVVHLGFLRGRNITNAIIMCSEAENLTREHVQLLIGRVAEGSALWLNWDCRQVDHEVFARNSGLQRAVDCLKGHPLFGYVKLQKTERSATAALADLLD